MPGTWNGSFCLVSRLVISILLWEICPRELPHTVTLYQVKPHLQINAIKSPYEPCHEIMALFVLRKLLLQTRMCNHPVGLDVWFFIGHFVYFHTSCVRTVKALARLRRWAGSPEPSLVAYAISTIMSWVGSYYHHDWRRMRVVSKEIPFLQSFCNEK